MTMATSWSYVPNDKYKSPGTIVRDLCRIVARGGSLLLNIGPGPDGEFAPEAYDRLQRIGVWMKVNSEAIYQTRPIPPYEKGDWVFTAKGQGSIYAILLPKDDGESLLEKEVIPGEILSGKTKVSLLGFGQLQARLGEAGNAVLTVPEAARQKLRGNYAWVFKLEN
jgi:alpha-L-fucosidase